MKIECPDNLIARIFRMSKALTRQRQAGVRRSTGIGIAEQREDGMIKRRRRDFDGAAPLGFQIGRQYPSEELLLPGDDKFLVGKRVVFLLFDQLLHFSISQEVFIK